VGAGDASSIDAAVRNEPPEASALAMAAAIGSSISR